MQRPSFSLDYRSRECDYLNDDIEFIVSRAKSRSRHRDLDRREFTRKYKRGVERELGSYKFHRVLLEISPTDERDIDFNLFSLTPETHHV